jgi:hypothetical protein
MNRILVKPSKSWFGGRRQWRFELRAANGELIDPRDTYANRDEASGGIVDFVSGADPLELVIYDRYGEVETRTMLR